MESDTCNEEVVVILITGSEIVLRRYEDEWFGYLDGVLYGTLPEKTKEEMLRKMIERRR